MEDYYFATEFDMPFGEAEEAVRAALKERGFGVLSEIDVQETLRTKAGAEMDRYKIFGACNPRLAHQSLQAEPRIGTMLPCNVILRQVGEGRVEVAAIDPVSSMQAVDNPNLAGIAHEGRALLQGVIHDLSGNAQQQPAESDAADDLVAAGSEYSFPASDPPSYMGGAAVAGPPPEKKEHTREPATSVPTDPAEVKPAGSAPQGTDPARVISEGPKKTDP